jgi:hypothetical protein
VVVGNTKKEKNILPYFLSLLFVYYGVGSNGAGWNKWMMGSIFFFFLPLLCFLPFDRLE